MAAKPSGNPYFIGRDILYGVKDVQHTEQSPYSNSNPFIFRAAKSPEGIMEKAVSHKDES